MRPLQAIGAGLTLVVLDVSFADPGWDLVPDPVGWLLVLLGVRRLPERIGRRRLLLPLAVVSGMVSLALWVPPLGERVLGLHASLRWALDLTTPAFVLVLALAMSAAAPGADTSARTWWRVVLVGTVATMLLPPVVYGAGAVALTVVAAVVAVASVVTCVVLCFAHSARPWVRDAPATDPLPG